ncbi:sensor histidine kinase [Buttiauxella noackiae]|uniref:histidine kinase n=1 Tax=Buttiauxella noackiae ATCC 51607 TaxID=1354255 RepID=A0A1B7HLC5_9ENTR|nr:HAMP domain-containing sensor histidine kinase [Buttiauxella noackiae]MCA1921148.1 HAMP domain-containing histidine kinase [Buttiauxella noackiae]OAT16356.1 osmosensitive K+ channel histidine kinase [Buttiauxella noackiae ATCC 51607]
MRKLTLSQRLTLVFALLLITSCSLLGWVQIRTSTQYSQAMIQQLSGSLAEHINQSYPLLGQDGLNNDSVRTLFDHLMTVNPSVEVYLLDEQGNIIGDGAPPDHIKRHQVDLAPIQLALNDRQYPIYGDDPRSLDGKKVFSVAPMRQNGQVKGYLYVILLGENYNALASDAQSNTLFKVVLLSISLVALLGLIVGGLAFRWITRPLRSLSRQVNALETGGMAEMQAMAALPCEKVESNDEISQLRQGVIMMARRISEQWHRLSQQDQLRREFIANISHDLRTPLTSLHGYLESLSVMSATLSEAEKKRYLEIALAQSQKVRTLAQSLFELARLEYGVVKPQKEHFCLSELLQDVFQKFELMTQTRQLQLVADIQPGLPLIDADLGMIERVLTNLLDNAIRHTPEQGTVAVRLWKEDEKVMVQISDNGPGIPQELKEGLFVRPSIVNQSHIRVGGLGLMIVRQMLQLHGSDIALVEGPETGACFRFGLPT